MKECSLLVEQSAQNENKLNQTKQLQLVRIAPHSIGKGNVRRQLLIDEPLNKRKK